MKDTLQIQCNTLADAQRVVMVLWNNKISADRIRFQPSEPRHSARNLPGHWATDLITPVTVICAIVGCVFAGLTIFLFPMNIMLVTALLVLAFCLFEPSLQMSPQKPRKIVGPAGNIGFHISVQVSSRTESDRLLIACEHILSYSTKEFRGRP